MNRHIVVALALPFLLPACGGGQSEGSLSAADVERFASAWDAPSRDEWQQPAEVVRLLDVSAGQTVVDVGAGTGYMLPHLSEAVGSDGHVIALEVEPALVEHLRTRVHQEHLSNVEVRLVPRDDPELGDGSADRILFLDTWTEIQDRRLYARHLLSALRNGGKIIVIDVTEDAAHGPPEGQRMLGHEVASELHSGRLHAVEVESSLPRQWAVVGGSAEAALEQRAEERAEEEAEERAEEESEEPAGE